MKAGHPELLAWNVKLATFIISAYVRIADDSAEVLLACCAKLLFSESRVDILYCCRVVVVIIVWRYLDKEMQPNAFFLKPKLGLSNTRSFPGEAACPTSTCIASVQRI